MNVWGAMEGIVKNMLPSGASPEEIYQATREAFEKRLGGSV
jgi:hypothetical protein